MAWRAEKAAEKALGEVEGKETASNTMSEEEKLYAAVVYSEAGGQSKKGK